MKLSLRITGVDTYHVRMDMLLNGALVSGPCGIHVRDSELVDFILKLDPDLVEVDSENVTALIRRRLRGLTAVRFY